MNNLLAQIHRLPSSLGQLISADPVPPQSNSSGGFADMLRNLDAAPKPETAVPVSAAPAPTPAAATAPAAVATPPTAGLSKTAAQQTEGSEDGTGEVEDAPGKPDTDTGEPGPPCIFDETEQGPGEPLDGGCVLTVTMDPEGGLSPASPNDLALTRKRKSQVAGLSDVTPDPTIRTAVDPGAAANQMRPQKAALPDAGIAKEPINTDLPPRTPPEMMATGSSPAQGKQQAERQVQMQALQATPLEGSSAAVQSFAAELQSSLSTARPGASAGSTGISSVASAGGLAAATATRADASDDAPATPTVIAMPEPLDDAGFAAALGARLTVLAKDGVQKAELHLNPADMGPVAVQITVDGSQAQVTFHAAQADTRGVLEQGLPDLAAALAASGLTLSGGGVFQQQSGARGGRENGSQAGSDRSASGRLDGGANALPQGMPVGTRARGVVDLYA